MYLKIYTAETFPTTRKKKNYNMMKYLAKAKKTAHDGFI